MTPHEAIQNLDAMQRQIIDGPTLFKDIADVIRELQCERDRFAQLVVEFHARTATRTKEHQRCDLIPAQGDALGHVTTKTQP